MQAASSSAGTSRGTGRLLRRPEPHPAHQRHGTFLQPLGVDDFVKKSSFIYYTREALEKAAPRIADFAEREGLHAHARSVTIRYE